MKVITASTRSSRTSSGEDEGIGKPELLKGDLSGWASRRINEEHGLVYRLVDAHDQLKILSCRYHHADR
jgi:toxin YoeB